MKIKNWFLSKQLWFRGGIIGVVVCIVLFLFDLFVYFPLIGKKYGNLPEWALIFPMVTGHFFPMLSGFIVPYGFLCKFTVRICSAWSVLEGPGDIPWKLDTGEAGYCQIQTMTPTTACANFSEMVGFFGLALLLMATYFAVGALFGTAIQRRKAK